MPKYEAGVRFPHGAADHPSQGLAELCPDARNQLWVRPGPAASTTAGLRLMDLGWVPSGLSADIPVLRGSCPGYTERDGRSCTVGTGLLARDQVSCPEQATVEDCGERHDPTRIGQPAAGVKRTLPAPDPGTSARLDTARRDPNVRSVMSNCIQSIRLLVRSGSLQAGS